MASYHPCAVIGCDDRTSTRHRFPNPEKDKPRFGRWIQLSGNEKLVDMEPKRVYQNYRICHTHFSSESKACNMFLKRTSLPSLHLPSKCLKNVNTIKT